ncbi:hypothetical protein [Gracilibacillus alcaliphilus]|uniref:hypothetical protein n=1 Tax=Gracilibacillus alcaliphilus TaxID=1401441 RepID=UPI0019574961|nr:hypothetical protein [Gracilibacillus alcaliphilus]MBM7679828.1 hypothetical protein [Gracilibacillus alcaliphilus]
MRSFLIGIIIMLSITLIGTGSVLAAKSKNEDEIMGVVYGEKIFALDSKDQLDVKLKINKLETENDILDVDLTLSYGGNEFDLETSGKVYPSGNTYTGGYLVDLNETENYSILSFKVEEEAKEALLLPINYDLTNKTVVKIAILDKNTNNLIYFEDTLSSSQQVNDIKEISQELTLDNFDDQNELNEQQEKIDHMESWFMPFLKPVGEKNVTEEDAGKVVSFAGEANNLPPLIPEGFFQTEGDHLSTYREEGGYYITTTTWPVGSENLLSDAIQWEWIMSVPNDFSPGDSAHLADTSLKLTHHGQFLYMAEERRLDRVNDIAYYRIKNPTVSGGIMDGDSEIISKVEKTANFEDFDISIDVEGLIGLVDLAKKFYIPQMLSVVNFQKETEVSPIITYQDSISGQMAVWDDVIRYYSYPLEDKFFKKPGDLIYLGYRVQLPTDADYERIPGKRNLEYNYQFDIYGRNAFGFYTKKIEEVEKYFKKGYEVLE